MITTIMKYGASVALWLLCLLPLALLLHDGLTNALSAEPIKELTQRTGW